MAITIRDLGLPYNSYRLYDVTFFDDTIKTLVTDTPCIVDTWISDIQVLHQQKLHRLIVGLDVEWRPNTGPNINNPLATLQLCVGRNCLIFQLLFAPRIPQSLIDFLADQDYTFVGVGIERDVDKLRSERGLEVAKAVDLRDLAADEYGLDHLRCAGLVGLAARVLGKEFVKPKWVTMSDWDDDWLSLDQIQYACVDAYVSFEIGRSLNAGAFKRFDSLLLDEAKRQEQGKKRLPLP
ncbi:hypothetical protein RJ640_022762 [Escallonia rubra]|uniref:3'-5' exonuclease domain-containing protein n=1 Tax=Escallonia rubra TaxID=112253 RepID=A0AA88QTI7_9ASTE|nr:hypothetical protein RJ640_022762 [Escallonia rubra]